MRSFPSTLPATASGVGMALSAPLSVPYIPAVSDALAASGAAENLLGELLFLFALLRLGLGFALLLYATTTASQPSGEAVRWQNLRTPIAAPTVGQSSGPASE
ncbi:MAG: hypothetical protein ABEI99_08645 [Halobaculum sp.]